MKYFSKKLIVIIALAIALPIFTYAQEPNQDPEPAESTPELEVSCGVSQDSGYYDTEFTWTANASGGEGSYTYNWSGDISGSGDSVSQSFNEAGVIQASVMVADLTGSTASADCSNVKIIAPLEFVSCNAVETNSNTGYEVEWEAHLTGGVAPYFMTWSGDDGLTGDSINTSITYTTTGEKTAKVSNISSSDGQSVVGEWDCSPTVTVVEAPTTLEVSCVADQSTITEGQSITWTASVSGGSEPYTIDWSGSDELSGTGESISKTYDSAGDKSATINVATSDGQSEIGVSCGTLVVEEDSIDDNNNSGSSSSSGGRRRSSSNNDDDDTQGDTSTATTTTGQTTNTTTFTPTNTGSITTNDSDTANQGDTGSDEDATTTDTGATSTATTSDSDLAAGNAGFLAFIGDINLDWLSDYWWIVLLLIILGVLFWFIIFWKRRKDDEEDEQEPQNQNLNQN
jgi:hypothetical protein